MARQTIPVNPIPPTISQSDSVLQGPLAHQVQQMEDIAHLTREAMSQIGEVTAYASFEMVRVLSTMALWEHAAEASGTLSPENKQALENIREALCKTVRRATENANAKILALLENLPVAPQNR